MNHTTAIFLALFIVFVAAQIGAEIAQRLKMPSVVGEIVAGCLVGPSVLGWVTIGEPLKVLAEIGAILLLFAVGLETRLQDLRKVGKIAASVGVAGVVLPFVLGFAWAYFSGFPLAPAMFVAAAFVATSAGITARVLSELGVLGRIEARVILGAAVIDDILAMLLLGVVTSLQSSEGVSLVRLSVVLVQALGFVALIALVGTRILKKSGQTLDAPLNPHSPLIFALAGCLGLAVAAQFVGLAAIIGAFLAGMAFAETPQRGQLERQMQVIMAFLTPFFFVVTGASVKLAELSSIPALLTLLFITFLAVVGKIAGGYWGARRSGKTSAFIVGVGMVPRGEVGIIVASLGLSAKVFDDKIYALIVAMSLLTSVLAPPVLKKWLAKSEEDERMEL